MNDSAQPLATDAATPYLAALNEAQRTAVETLDGPVLVLAGAGTGKTRVLTTRLAHLLAVGRAHPGQILAVTFTNKAAREMKDRVAGLLQRPVEGWWLGTFHAVAARILRRHAERVGLRPDFTILDTDDQLRLLKQVLESENIDDRKWPPRAILALIERWKDRGLTPDRVSAGEAASLVSGRALAIFEAYQGRLRDLNACDFGDLIVHNLALLQTCPDVLEEQVERMLADEKAIALGENFAGQWLQVRNLHSVTPDPEKFPAWNSALRDDMMTETVLFFNHMLRENRPLGDFLDADFTFVNDRLAQLYGIDGVSGPEFRQVALPSDERGGILGHASVLTVTSYPSRTSPTIRGKYLLENILGAPPPPPPPDVPALEEAAVSSAASLREQMEQHRSNAVCASCHARMDTLGFALETYDGIGRWRTKDGDMPIDASGVLPNGKALSGPAELRAVLKEDLPEFARTVTEKSLTYALGRGLERFDRITVNRILDQVEATGYGFRDLVHEVIRSPAFQMRRGEAAAAETASGPKEIASR